MSRDRRFGVTVIAFIGSVFSPYYAWSGRGDPENHCAVNVALYRPGGNLWAMTERGKSRLRRTADTLEIGKSRLSWQDRTLVIDINETAVPFLTPIRGKITVRPDSRLDQAYDLDGAGKHVWRPIAPRAATDVDLSPTHGRWSGEGYLDSNWGAEPIEDGFEDWDWSRAHLKDKTLISYDVKRRGGDCAHLALAFDRTGEVARVAPPPAKPLSPGLWRMPRWVRPPAGAQLSAPKTLEDTPFYTRTWLSGELDGQPVEMMHESLSADRLRSPIVKAMLPFRMPRSGV